MKGFACVDRPEVHEDGTHNPAFLTEETPDRLLGGTIRDLPGPFRTGPPGVHDPLRAGPAQDVMALTVAERAARRSLLSNRGSHTRIPGRLLVHAVEHALGQHGGKFLDKGVQLKLVPHGAHSGGQGHEPQLLGRGPGVDAVVAPSA